MKFDQLKAMFAAAGCVKLYAKRLAENDNSKNQVYLGPNFQVLNLLPNEGVQADSRAGNSTFKAKLNFGWMLSTGQVAQAAHAQLILYPQYPEVRFSGFLKGCRGAPSDLMASRFRGRVLFLGVTGRSEIIGYVAAGDSPVEAEFRSLGLEVSAGVFVEIPLPGGADEAKARKLLLKHLKRISSLGWIDSKQLDQSRVIRPCDAPQCGGFTLEAELDIPKNSAAAPDFMGWEVKQHTVANFSRPLSGRPITLMTPEPTGGIYQEQGPEYFVREYGYPDQRGRVDRLNFGGVHKVNSRQARTGLTLTLDGYDPITGKITNTTGALLLVSAKGEIAASWAFGGLLTHWAKKHARAVYVPSKCEKRPSRKYAYGPKVRLAEGTDPLLLLNALSQGSTYYDPAIKIENASTTPSIKRRSQFRIASKNISLLYERVEIVDLFADD